MRQFAIVLKSASLHAWQPFHFSDCWIPKSLTFPRQQFIRTRPSCRHWGQQSYRRAESKNNSPLVGMTANSFEYHPTTVGWQSDQQKEWQTAAGVKYNERTVQNRLLRQSFNNQPRFAKDPKDWPFTDVWNFQLRPGEAYKLPTVKLIGGSVIICFSKAGIRHIRLCEGHMNQATYKVVLEENLLSALTTREDWCF